MDGAYQRADELATGEINVKRFGEAVKLVEQGFRLCIDEGERTTGIEKHPGSSLAQLTMMAHSQQGTQWDHPSCITCSSSRGETTDSKTPITWAMFQLRADRTSEGQLPKKDKSTISLL